MKTAMREAFEQAKVKPGEGLSPLAKTIIRIMERQDTHAQAASARKRKQSRKPRPVSSTGVREQ